MVTKIWNKYVNRETISYLIFGVLTTLVDWAVYTILWRYEVDYRVSTVISWCAAVLFAFGTNRQFVFQSTASDWRGVGKEFTAFVACRGLTGLFTLIGMIVMVQGLHLHEMIGKVFVSAASLVFNYVFSKLVIFKKKPEGEEL